jgi:hypothetical protein
LEKPQAVRPLREAHILAQHPAMTTEKKNEKWKTQREAVKQIMCKVLRIFKIKN